MGGGASKKSSSAVQPPAPISQPVDQIKTSARIPTPPSPGFPTVPSRQPSAYSRASSKRSIQVLTNGNGYRTPSRKLDTYSVRETNDDALPPINNEVSRRTSNASSKRPSSVVVFPPPIINRSQQDLNGSTQSLNRKNSIISNQQLGRCPYCKHCQQTVDDEKPEPKAQPKWLMGNPGIYEVHINMDEYDVAAVKAKVLKENGHIPGSYDYQPYLTIEETDQYDHTKENYYTQPFVAKTKPRISPVTTPFPEYSLLQRRELRLNKPYSVPLFDD